MTRAKAPAGGEGWRNAFHLAMRESRGGFHGFRVFALALILGVFAIAAVGSLSAAFLAGLDKEQRRLLDGDYEITAIDTTFSDDFVEWLRGQGEVSFVTNAQLMVHASDKDTRSVVQLKAVDDAYPLIGKLEFPDDTQKPSPLAEHRAGTNLYWGALADQQLFDKLELMPGDRIRIGLATFVLQSPIHKEPDRASAGFLISPRLIISQQGAEATGLIERSGLVRRSVRIVMPEEARPDFETRIDEAFPDHPWQIRSAGDAAGGLQRTLENLDVFLTLIGLSALVIGGVGAANAVHAYMQRKLPVIATLKCLGATGDFIMKTYVSQVLCVTAFAVGMGLFLGLLTPYLVLGLFGGLLPFEASTGIYPLALLRAGLFGILAALIFALWPLAKAKKARPARLFRSIIEPDGTLPSRADLLLIAGLAAAFVGMAIISSRDPMFTLIFSVGGLVVFLILAGISWFALRLVRRYWKPSRPELKLAITSLTRSGSAAGNVIVSIGMGLTMLAMISLIDTNLSREVRNALPDKAPQLFFSDINFDEVDRFDTFIKSLGEPVEVERYLMLRSGIKLLNGQPLESVEGAANSAWARQNDWGVTILEQIPEALGTIKEGEPWPTDYRGPPLLSLSHRQAERFDLNVGDTMTLTIAGRDVTARIQTLHDVNWDRNGLNFVAIFAPGTLEKARPTSIGSLRLPSAVDEQKIASSINQAFPDVTIIRTREVTASIADIIDGIGMVIRALSAVTLLAGLIVLMGAIASDFRRKLKDAMIMKAMGAGRRRIVGSYGVEYAILGLIPALAALALGAMTSWFVVDQQMELQWQLSTIVLVSIVGGATLCTLILGIGTAWHVLNARPWPVLRSD